MWKARLCFLRFPRKRKIPLLVFGDFFLPSFPRPSRRQAQLLEEFAFGLLYALSGFGVAAGGGDALQDGEGESRARALFALWLMRLSYIRYALKTATDPRALLE